MSAQRYYYDTFFELPWLTDVGVFDNYTVLDVLHLPDRFILKTAGHDYRTMSRSPIPLGVDAAGAESCAGRGRRRRRRR